MYLTNNTVARRRVRMGSPRLASLGFLGATTSAAPETPTSANAAQAMAALSIPSNDAYFNWTLDAIEQGELPDYEPGVLTGTAVQFEGGTSGCSSEKTSSKAALISAIGGTGVAVTGTILTASAAAAGTGVGLPVALGLIAASVVIQGISALFNHHAKAVAAERGMLCAAVPAANAALEQLAAWFQSGQINISTYQQSLASVQQQFASMTSSVTSSGSVCNEGCIYNRALKGIVSKLIADLGQLGGGELPGAEAGSERIAPSSGNSNIAVYAVLGLLAYALLG